MIGKSLVRLIIICPRNNQNFFERINYYLIRIPYYLILDNYHPYGNTRILSDSQQTFHFSLSQKPEKVLLLQQYLEGKS